MNLQRSAAIVAAALLAPACALRAGEDLATTSAAATSMAATTPAVTGLQVLATDQQMAISFTASGAATVSLTDADGYASTQAAVANTAGIQEVGFTGLAACTQYTWSISIAGSVVRTGVSNTRFSTSIAACPSTATVAPSKVWFFQGLEHQGSGVYSWPDGFAWHASTYTALGAIQYGYQHWSNGGESIVDSQRQRVDYTLSNMQVSRGVANATFSAQALGLSNGGTCASNGLPALTTQPVGSGVWVARADGPLWSGVSAFLIPGAEPNWALDDDATTLPLYPIQVAGTTATISIPTPPQTIILGFDAPNDGYFDRGNLEPSDNPTFANDNNSCLRSLQNPTMTITMGPMPPETPLCTASLSCTTTTVTCNPSLATFTLYAADVSNPNRLVQSVSDSGLSAAVLTDGSGSPGESYTVCTSNAAGQTNCAPVPFASEVACPSEPASLTIEATALWSGGSATAILLLNAPAAAGGSTVTLGQSWAYGAGPALTMPASVFIPAGQTKATFTIGVPSTFTGAATADVIATTGGGEVDAYALVFSGNVWVAPVAATTLGQTAPVNVYVRNAPGAGGATVSFAEAGTGALSLQGSATVPAGETMIQFSATATKVGMGTVTATYQGSSETSSFEVLSPPPVHGPVCGGRLCQ
jgi:hypothetical protein